MGKEPQKFIEN